MDIQALVEKVGGEIVRGRVRVRRGAEYVVLAENVNGTMQLTPEGAKLAEEVKPKRRGRPKKEEVSLPETAETPESPEQGLTGEG